MKKTLLLVLAALTLSSSAVNAATRKWDFTQWSDATKANLAPGNGVVSPTNGWSDIEKADNSTPSTNGGCYWQIAKSVSSGTTGVTLQANGVDIAELKGLVFNNCSDRNLALAINYPSTSLGEYAGGAYLWLGGMGYPYIILENVPKGAIIEAKVESHKPAEGRGIELFVGRLESKSYSASKKYARPTNTMLKGPDGEAVAVPKTATVQQWVVPTDEIAEAANEDGTYDISIVNTNGCHLYYITVSDEQGTTKQLDVAYLSNGGVDEDFIYQSFIANFQSTAIDLSNTEAGIDSLVKFDAVVLAPSLAAGNGYGKLLDELDQKVPVVNLSTNLYEEAGWGKIEASEEEAYTVNEDYMDAAIFEATNAGEGTLTLFEGAPVYAVTPAEGSFIAEDTYYATPGIHTHGEKRNQYILLPFPADEEALGGMTEDAGQLLNNAIAVVAATKKSVTKVANPVVSQKAENGLTIASISCGTVGSSIFYSIDGSAFAAYTEALNITKDGTVVKAYASARGYLAGDTVSATINVLSQAAVPTIATTSVEGATTIALSVADGLKAYYSFNGTTVAASAVPYTEPVTVNEPVVLTCFAAGEGVLQSEILTQAVDVYGIPAVKDTVAHFTANQTDWFDNCELKDAEGNVLEFPTANWAAKAAYYFGKSAWAFYNTEDPKSKVVYAEDGVTPLKSLVNPEQDSTVVYYDPNPASLKYVYSKTDSQWVMKTQGQVLTGETNVAASSIYGPAQSGNGYFAESPLDMINNPSKGKLTFGGKGSGEPWSAEVISTVKFAAPFDVVTYLTNGNSSTKPVLALEVSSDGENWTTVKDTIAIGTKQRWYKRDRISVAAEMGEVYVRVKHMSGGSSAQLYDIIIITTEGTTGIETLAADEAASANEAAIFDLQGRQVATMVSGQLYIKAGKKVIIK